MYGKIAVEHTDGLVQDIANAPQYLQSGTNHPYAVKVYRFIVKRCILWNLQERYSR